MAVPDLLSKNKIVATLILVVLAILYTFPVGEGDFFWHVKTGQWIWQHHRLPSTDPFSFTVADVNPFRSGSHRITFILRQYWLGQLAFYGIWHAAGEAGMVYFRAVAYTGILAFLFCWSGRLKQGVAPLVTLLLMGNVLRNYPNERPQIFAFILMPLMLWLLERLRTREGGPSRGAAIALPVVMVIWSNCHGSFILGLAIITLYAAFFIFEGMTQRRPLSGKTIAVLLASMLATAINPNGLSAFGEFFSLTSGYKRQITEYISPITLAWQHHTLDYWYWSLLIIALVCIVLNFRRMAGIHLLVILSLLGLSLTGVRYIPFFVLAVPLLSPYLPDWRPRGRLLLLPLAAVLVWAATADYRNVFKFRAERSFPVKAVTFINSVGPAGNLFNYMGWGGYLMCYSNYPVFIDGRTLVEEYVSLHDAVLAGADWQKILTTYRINVIVIPGTNRITGDAYPLLLQILDDRSWALVYQDEVALVFVRNTQENRAIVTRHALDKGLISRHIMARWSWQFENDF